MKIKENEYNWQNSFYKILCGAKVFNISCENYYGMVWCLVNYLRYCNKYITYSKINHAINYIDYVPCCNACNNQLFWHIFVNQTVKVTSLFYSKFTFNLLIFLINKLETVFLLMCPGNLFLVCHQFFPRSLCLLIYLMVNR